VWKWQRQQSKDFYDVGFDALLNDGTSITMLVEDMSRKNVSSRFEYHMFYVLYPVVTYLLTLPHTNTNTTNMTNNTLKIFITADQLFMQY
jgi:hypothetical protein